MIRSAHRRSPAGREARVLETGLAEMGLSLEPPVHQRLLSYIALLGKWNRVYNLTAVRKPEQMVTRHLLDSLSVLQFLREPRILDVGSGAGLPGIPLALARPQWEFVLLDSNGKKARFLTQAVAELGLSNVSVAQARVEEYQSEVLFTTIISRAFASVGEFVTGARHLLAPGGIYLAMKGAYPVAEMDHLPAGYAVVATHQLQVPGLDAQRHAIELQPSEPAEAASGDT
ncbi:MAG: hypothetical protein AMS22_02690 [Thiotrichales bacterium SG8_50]|nr:MAG: hypothetical protein AMS22_02690 [Thiotrichales bacterium SG8_50]